jgi:hypothetical protein
LFETAQYLPTNYPLPVQGFSTGLPTATFGKLVKKRQLSPLVPTLSSTYPQAYTQTYPQFTGKGDCIAGKPLESVKNAATSAWMVILNNLPTAYAQACTQAYAPLVQWLAHRVIHT